jgi:RNA polymerase sigma-70 factor (ECF subfamily)
MITCPGVVFETRLQHLIGLAELGNRASLHELFTHARFHLLKLTRLLLRDYPSLRRWEQTDDLFQNAMIRLHRAMEKVKVESVSHFFNLAAMQIRRELFDMARKHFGPEGIAANHHTDGLPADDKNGVLDSNAEQPECMAAWTEFHAMAGKLPPEEFEVFNLVYYEGLTQEEAARSLGISFRTLKRRWQSAKVRLYEEWNRGERG